MNKHCMSVVSLRVGTPLGFDQRWPAGGGAHARGVREGGGEGSARARRKSASDFSFIIYFSNASDSLKVQDTSPEY